MCYGNFVGVAGLKPVPMLASLFFTSLEARRPGYKAAFGGFISGSILKNFCCKNNKNPPPF